MKNNRIFYLKIFLYLVVKFSIYLNRRVFVMKKIIYEEWIHFVAYPPFCTRETTVVTSRLHSSTPSPF